MRTPSLTARGAGRGVRLIDLRVHIATEEKGDTKPYILMIDEVYKDSRIKWRTDASTTQKTVLGSRTLAGAPLFRAALGVDAVEVAVLRVGAVCLFFCGVACGTRVSILSVARALR